MRVRPDLVGASAETRQGAEALSVAGERLESDGVGMKHILKAECGQYSVRLHRNRPQLPLCYPVWGFDGLLIYGYVAVWFE